MLCRKRQADANSCGRRISTLDLERVGSGRIVAAVLRERTQRFGTGTRLARARKNPKAASGGPIHVRLTLGNSKVPALRILPAQGRIARDPAHDAHRTGVCFVCTGSTSSAPLRPLARKLC